MKKINIHFVGIKGVGMTPLAIVAKEAGFGVTGSDGKTTTAHLIYEILRFAGKKTGLISSISVKIGAKDFVPLLITISCPFDTIVTIKGILSP